MKIKLNENITAAAKHLFETHGHQCDTVADEELTGAPDAKLIDICRSEQRMLITFDLGFGGRPDLPTGRARWDRAAAPPRPTA